jgi:HAE1 family hydrophobic/amphiphilic exporter-1
MTLLTRLSLANRAIVALLSVLIVAVGLVVTSSMKQELLPSTEQPTAVVVVAKPGVSSETLDRQTVVPLVRALTGVTGVDEVRSSTTSGSAQISLTWGFGGDNTKILAEIEAVTSRTVGTDAGISTTVYSGSTADIPVLALAITSDDDLATLATRIDESLIPVISNIAGVREVSVAGRTQERVVVTADPAALAAKSIDPSVIAALLRTAGTIIPAGTSVDGDQAISIEVGQETTSVADLAALPIPTLDGPVPLGEVATVELVPLEQTSMSRVDGRPSIGLTITKTPDANAVQVSHAVNEAIAAAIDDVGPGAAAHTVFDQSTMVEQSIHDLSVEGGLGLLFAVLVILVFLLSPRATVITAISIPMSLLIAVIGLRIGGFSLNIFTLAALTVAVGRVVDDSIVVIENITRRRGPGGLTPQSVKDSVAQVAGAVTASTLTTVAVFLPIAFIGGVEGELFRPFAVTVAVALLASLVVSLTIVPVLAFWFMRGPRRDTAQGELEAQSASATSAPAITAGETGAATVEAGSTRIQNGAAHDPVEADRVTRLQRAYLPSLRFALRRPVVMVLIAVVVFAGSIVAAGFLKTDLLGSFADARAVQVQQTMPLTSTLAVADAAATRVEDALADVDGVESVQTTIGALGAPVQLDLVLTPEVDATTALAEITSAVSALPAADTISVSTQATQTTSATIDVILTGSDETALAAATETIMAALADRESITKVTSDLANDLPVLSVAVDQTAAAAQGFGVAEIGAAIAAAVEGERLGTVSVDGSARDLILRSQSTATTPESIASLPLPVSVLQQQRTQKNAVDALTAEQTRIGDAAQADATRAAERQISELIASRAQTASDLAALQGQLDALLANPPAADPTPVTAGELAALQYQQSVQQLAGAVEGSRAGIVALDAQIAASRTAIADAAAQQAEADRLAEVQRGIDKLRASPVLVRDVATVTIVNAPATLTRIDGVRAVTISATPVEGDLGAAALTVDEVIASIELPAGVSLDQGGAAEDQLASFGQLGLAMLIAVALVYIVLVATFRSLAQPLILLVSVPLAATGAIVGLLITGTPLGIPALIGMLMLIGIVVTNAIVLIDLINEVRRSGASVDEAVIRGARLRLRPIIMTAMATIFALLPMAIGLTGGGVFISKSLAIVVIGGLVSSTLLTLLVVPALYVIQGRRTERRAAASAARHGGTVGGGTVGVGEIESATMAPESGEHPRGRLAT